MEEINWQISKKGNSWCRFMGLTCTVFKTDDGLYKGIVVGEGGVKEYTKDYADEEDCKEATLELAEYL